MKKITVSILVVLIVLIVLPLPLTASAGEEKYALKNITEEEFNCLYGEKECPDSYFIPIAYYGLTYDVYKEALENEGKFTYRYGNIYVSNQVMCCDKNGKISHSVCRWSYGHGMEDSDFDWMNDLSLLQLTWLGEKNEANIMAFLAPWCLYDGENFYTWNDLMSLSINELSKINYSFYGFKTFISSVKSEMSKRGWWNDGYEDLYTLLKLHEDDYDAAHKGEKFYPGFDGSKVYLSEICRQANIKKIELYYQCYFSFDKIIPVYNIDIYSFNPYTKEFADWFLSVKGDLEDSSFKLYMTEFCESFYSPELPDIGGEGYGMYGGINMAYYLFEGFNIKDMLYVEEFAGKDIGGYGCLWNVFKAHKTGILTDDDVASGLAEKAYIDRRGRFYQSYYDLLVGDSWYDLLKSTLMHNRYHFGSVILYLEYNDFEKMNRSVGCAFREVFTKEQLESIDDPYRVYSDLLELRTLDFNWGYTDFGPGETGYARLEENIKNVKALMSDPPSTSDSTAIYVVIALASIALCTVVLFRKGRFIKE